MQRYRIFECQENLYGFFRKKTLVSPLAHPVSNAFHEFSGIVLEEVEIHCQGNVQDQIAV